MQDHKESEWKTDSFFERFVYDDEFRELLEVSYEVPNNSNSNSNSDSNKIK